MADIRYAARTGPGSTVGSVERDVDTDPAWFDALEVNYMTDPELIAAVLPPPLEPAPEPLVRLTLATGTTSTGEKVDHFWFGVRAQHEGTQGDYALLVGASSDHELIESRELRGEPCKLIEITPLMNASRIQHKAERRGHVVARIVGTVDSPRSARSRERVEFSFRGVPGAPKSAPPTEIELMMLRRTITERRAVAVVGATRLGVSPYDPLSDLNVRRTNSIDLSQRTMSVEGHPIRTVPYADVEPFLHQRYDHFGPRPKTRSKPGSEPVRPVTTGATK